MVADIRHPTHRDDLDALRAEAAARSSREHPQGLGVARPLDQYDGGDVCGVTAHSCPCSQDAMLDPTSPAATIVRTKLLGRDRIRCTGLEG